MNHVETSNIVEVFEFEGFCSQTPLPPSFQELFHVIRAIVMLKM